MKFVLYLLKLVFYHVHMDLDYLHVDKLKHFSICTLGALGDVQILDGLGTEESKRFMHHYNFPHFSVGETRPMRGPGRREIGHGALGERALTGYSRLKKISLIQFA